MNNALKAFSYLLLFGACIYGLGAIAPDDYSGYTENVQAILGCVVLIYFSVCYQGDVRQWCADQYPPEPSPLPSNASDADKAAFAKRQADHLKRVKDVNTGFALVATVLSLFLLGNLYDVSIMPSLYVLKEVFKILISCIFVFSVGYVIQQRAGWGGLALAMFLVLGNIPQHVVVEMQNSIGYASPGNIDNREGLFCTFVVTENGRILGQVDTRRSEPEVSVMTRFWGARDQSSWPVTVKQNSKIFSLEGVEEIVDHRSTILGVLRSDHRPGIAYVRLVRPRSARSNNPNPWHTEEPAIMLLGAPPVAPGGQAWTYATLKKWHLEHKDEKVVKESMKKWEVEMIYLPSL